MLGSLLFLILISNEANSIQHRYVSFFADDTRISMTVSSTKTTENRKNVM